MTFTKIGEALDKISVLGTDYTVHFIPEGEETRLKGCDGFCDETTKEIVVENYKRGEMGSKGNLELQEQMRQGCPCLFEYLIIPNVRGQRKPHNPCRNRLFSLPPKRN